MKGKKTIMKPTKAHCLFEQSGTFKREFIKLGIPAEDYDILNQFNETDHIIDLYGEIESAYKRERESIFDSMKKTDIVMAFFPCIRFEAQILLFFKGKARGTEKWSIKRKLEYDLKLHQELAHNYDLITKLVIVALDRGLKLIIENPYSTQHYLHRYWALEPALIDDNRAEKGDYYKKPTQYFFINCEPKSNIVFDALPIRERKKVIDCSTVERSMISPEYARRFIQENIIDNDDLERGYL